MKKLLTLLLSAGLMLAMEASAQTGQANEKNNAFKINLSALAFKNFSFQYERKISKRMTAAANVRYMAFDQLPFLSTIQEVIDDPSVPAEKLKLGAFGVTPEIRFYVGKKGAFHGFYIGPFASYNNYKTDLPITYDNDTKTGIFAGDVRSITGGLQFGSQWQLGKSVTLDWWIFGPNYGSAKGDLNFNGSLTASEQQDIRDQIEDLRSDAPFDNLIESYTVNNNGAFIKAKGPWGGLRGLGINLGIKF